MLFRSTSEGLKLAFTFLLTARGTPLVYYGDEIALPGGNDPDNRRDFPGGWAADARNAFQSAGRTPEEQSVWSHLQKLLRLRAARRELREARTEDLYVSEQAYVYRRGKTVVALNNDTKPYEVRLPVTGIPDDALGLCPAPQRRVDGVTLVIPARSGCVL